MLQFFFLLVYDGQLGFQIFFHGFCFHLLALDFFLALVQYQFALFQLVFCLLYLLVTLGHFFFQVCLLVQEFFLYFQQLILLNHFRFRFRISQDTVVFVFQPVLEEQVRGKPSDNEAGNG